MTPIAVLVLSLLLAAALMGLIVATGYRAWQISAKTGLAQACRETCLCLNVMLSGAALWWDLFNEGQFPLDLREWVTFPALIIGIIGYVLIAMDLEDKYKGFRSMQHEFAGLKHQIQGYKDALNLAEEDRLRCEHELERLRNERPS